MTNKNMHIPHLKKGNPHLHIPHKVLIHLLWYDYMLLVLARTNTLSILVVDFFLVDDFENFLTFFAGIPTCRSARIWGTSPWLFPPCWLWNASPWSTWIWDATPWSTWLWDASPWTTWIWNASPWSTWIWNASS